MSKDLSTRKASGAPLRVADALLRSLGGSTIRLRLTSPGDTSDAAQLGLAAPQVQDVVLAPALFRKVRVPMQEGQPAKYEVLISASAVAAIAGDLMLTNSDLLFQMALGMMIENRLYLIEAVAAPELFGQAYLYRLLVRESQPQAQ